jgi:DNA transformation protein and related proteins
VPVSAEFREYVTDLFERFGEVKIKPMFGGAGIYHKDQFFALIIGERIFLKTDDTTRPAFEKEGAEPFAFQKAGETIVTSYMELPSRLLDDPEEVTAWARRAYDVAIAARGRKRKPATAGLPRELPIASPKRKKK